MTRVYMDGVFDLFHYGHIRAIKQCREIGEKENNDKKCTVIIGLIADDDVATYKRIPIFSLKERAEIIGNIKDVDEVIVGAPLVVTKQFIQDNKIDLVVHGFKDDDEFESVKYQHKVLIDMGIFKKSIYTTSISTSDIINKIRTIDTL